MVSSDPAQIVQEPRSYSHAPIREAIIQIRVQLDESTQIEDLKTLLDGDSSFRAPDVQFQLRGEVQFNEGVITGGTTGGEPVGLSFVNHDGSRIVQSWVDRFAFSWVGNYTNWDEFLAEALSYWARYKAVAHPVAIQQVSVRYVNVIALPEGPREIKDYLRTSVDVSPYLPQAVSGLFMQVTIPLETFDCSVNITSVLQFPRLNESELVLDIDVISAQPLNQVNFVNNDSLVEALGVLRRAKNHVFEACITDATRSLIQ